MFTYMDKEDGHKIPISVWLDRHAYFNDDVLVKQTENLARLPFLHGRVALTPDGHPGYGMPIGGIIGAREYVIPNAVGVDIGCGMGAVKTDAKVPNIETLKLIKAKIMTTIPVGFNHMDKPCSHSLMPRTVEWFTQSDMVKNHELYPIVSQEYEKARYSLGTLGGGNHFIELQADEEDNLWIMLHSGSRNLGKKVCDYYNDAAMDLNKIWYSTVPKEWELAFLPMNEGIGRSYIREMEYCLMFAKANRQFMIDVVKGILADSIGCCFVQEVNIHHNYAAMEHHDGVDVMVHRKGATRARTGELGIIPGSQGTNSYIVSGLGNDASFMSCSHGAGRTMGRKEAIRKLSLIDETKSLNKRGILHSLTNQSKLDEAPSAYKDIDTVMANQEDLVSIVTKLRPLAVVKG